MLLDFNRECRSSTELLISWDVRFLPLDSSMRKSKIDPFGTTLIEDYERLFEEFGIKSFRPLLRRYPILQQLCAEG